MHAIKNADQPEDRRKDTTYYNPQIKEKIGEDGLRTLLSCPRHRRRRQNKLPRQRFLQLRRHASRKNLATISCIRQRQLDDSRH